MDRFEVKEFLKKAEKIPTIPGVALEIQRIVADPRSAADDLSRIIQNDQSLTAKVMRMVNSAYYGLRQKVKSVKQAVVILGFNTVKSLAVSAALLDRFPTGGEVHGFHRGKFWEHTIAVAAISRMLAQRMKVPKDEEEVYFISGLLHDLGKVILDQYFPERFTEVLDRIRSANLSFIEAERALGGVHHAEIGGLLAAQWEFPPEHIAAIRFHHEPDNRTEHQRIIAAVHFANCLAKTQSLGFSGDEDISGLSERAVASLGLSESVVEKMISGEIQQEYDKGRSFLKVLWTEQ